MYGAKELAEGFRTVRKNTIRIAEDIPADKYDFKAAPDVKSVGEMLAHLAVSPRWQLAVHGDRVSSIDFAFFGTRLAQAAAEERALQTKEQIIAALEQGGDQFETFVNGLTPDVLAEHVTLPPAVQPSRKTRFEMILGVKEHEMHHRGQLMLIERILGIVPHLTRQREATRAAAGARA
jgi:uncharacterized damage-inducible protein DinB